MTSSTSTGSPAAAPAPLRIAYLGAGAGGMVCGSCIRDSTLVRELARRGHDAVLLPIYTPLKTDDLAVEQGPVFYGAINVYLEQRLPFLRRLPRLLHDLLDRPALLRLLPTSNATDAGKLGDLALSVLDGANGRQAAELDLLVAFLRDQFQPQIVQIPNSMLLGLAPRLRAALPGVRLVCALQGEDLFVRALAPEWQRRVVERLREHARAVDLFLATSEFYAGFMSEWLGLERARVRVAPLGINLAGHGRAAEPPGPPWVIGYLGRFGEEKGFHLLVEAFCLLSERLGRGQVELRAAGYLGSRDRAYQQRALVRLHERGLLDHAEVVGEVDRESKIELLRSLHVFSMPATYPEPKGLPVLEAMANGVPVVQPNWGTFSEVLERTGGGVLVAPNDPAALADAIEALLLDPERRATLGARARAGVEAMHSAEVMAAATEDAYRAALRLRPAA